MKQKINQLLIKLIHKLTLYQLDKNKKAYNQLVKLHLDNCTDENCRGHNFENIN